MFVVVISLVAGVVLLLVGLGKIAHVGDVTATISIGISFGLFLFAISRFVFGRRRPPAPEEKVGG
jgi:hypothetical protein